MNFKERYQFNIKSDLIGKGGFSRVYRAYDTIRSRDVALKFYYGSWSNKYDIISEISRIDDIIHPNLIRYYDADILKSTNTIGEEEKIQVGIMEYANGGDLSGLFSKKDNKLYLRIIRDILSGLSYLHKKGIAHRDLKPKNILLHNEGGNTTAKIGDFGISKIVGKGDHEASTQLLGSVEYMAPEQFNTQKYGVDGQLGTNVDLWSVGIISYELLTHKTPFGNRSTGLSNEQILSNILFNEILLNKGSLPEPFKTIVSKCLVKRAAERITSADELIAIIDKFESEQAPARVDLPEEKPKLDPNATQLIDKRQWADLKPTTVSQSPMVPEPLKPVDPEPIEATFAKVSPVETPQEDLLKDFPKEHESNSNAQPELDTKSTQVFPSRIFEKAIEPAPKKPEETQIVESIESKPPVKKTYESEPVSKVTATSVKPTFDLKSYGQSKAAGVPKSAVAKQEIERGMRFFEQHNFDASINILDKYLASGELNTKAKFYLAYMYYNGKCGGKHNSALGRKLMAEAKQEDRALVLDLMLNNVLDDYKKSK